MKIKTFKSAFLIPCLLLLLCCNIARSQSKQLREEKFIPINGIEQYITINGESSKPVILFLHGGPGSTMSPYSEAIYGKWLNDFIIVQWDQRGAGKTFGRNAPGELTPEFLAANPLTVAQITADGIAVSEYLLKHLSKKKIILFGSSWGSVVGIKMASARPDLFTAYVTHSQVVDPAAEFPATYQKIAEMAQKANDTASVNLLRKIGAPPYQRARDMGKMIRVIKKYERQNSAAMPESWMTLSANYKSAEDEQHRQDGDDYSFVNYAGDSKLQVNSMMSGINLLRDNTQFSIPIYFIQGESDILTPKEVTRAYFDKIAAPKKEYILLSNSAHGFNSKVVDAQLKIFKSL